MAFDYKLIINLAIILMTAAVVIAVVGSGLYVKYLEMRKKIKEVKKNGI